jgi:uncharacterized membrane protein YhaH (DUF805 family)
MLGAIKYGLSNLVDISGRDSRQTFWYYVLFVYLLGMTINALVTLPMMFSAMQSMFDGMRANPGNEEAAQAAVYAMMADMMGPTLWVAVGVGALKIALLAASLVRRLHDSNLSGYWALVPGLSYAIAVGMMPASIERMMAAMQQAMHSARAGADPFAMQMQMMQSQGLSGLIVYVPLLMVIYMGVRPSTPGPNRFGDHTVQF